jgi:hypothetical protein
MFYIETDADLNYINSQRIETIYILPNEHLWRVFIRLHGANPRSYLYSEHDSSEKAKQAAQHLIGQIQRAPLDMLKIQIHEIMDTIADAGIFAGIPPFNGTAH